MPTGSTKAIIQWLLDSGVIWYAQTAPDHFVLEKDRYQIGDLVCVQPDNPTDPNSQWYIIPFPLELLGPRTPEQQKKYDAKRYQRLKQNPEWMEKHRQSSRDYYRRKKEQDNTIKEE